MTWRNYHGPLNALEAIRHVLQSKMPAAITAHNAAQYATAIARLDGSYTVSSAKTLIASVNGGTAVTAPIAAGTYTATQLVTAVNIRLNACLIVPYAETYHIGAEGGTLGLSIDGGDDIEVNLSEGDYSQADLIAELTKSDFTLYSYNASALYLSHPDITPSSTLTIGSETNGVATALGLIVGTGYKSTGMQAERFGSSGIAIRSNTAGSAYVTIGAGTINTILGFDDNSTWHNRDIREPAQYWLQHENLMKTIPEYPAGVLFCLGADCIPQGTYDHQVDYEVQLDVYESWRGADNQSLSGLLYSELMRLAEVHADVLRLATNAASAGGLVDGVMMRKITPERNLRYNNGVYYAKCSITLRVRVLETVT